MPVTHQQVFYWQNLCWQKNGPGAGGAGGRGAGGGAGFGGSMERSLVGRIEVQELADPQLWEHV